MCRCLVCRESIISKSGQFSGQLEVQSCQDGRTKESSLALETLKRDMKNKTILRSHLGELEDSALISVGGN